VLDSSRAYRKSTVSARRGLPDPASNPRLRGAVIAARQANMPKDPVVAQSRRPPGTGVVKDYVDVRYEGYGPAGVAVIVRLDRQPQSQPPPDILTAFNHTGGTLGETTLSASCSPVGGESLPASGAGADDMLEARHRSWLV